MESEKTNELFIDYIENGLSNTERELFEQRLKDDSHFAEDFAAFKSIYSVLENQFSEERTAVLKTIKEADSIHKSKASPEGSGKKTIDFKPWKMGVAATILLAIGLFVFNNFNKPTYTDYVMHQSISLTQRSDAAKMEKNAENAFNSENFEAAVHYFNELLKTSPEEVQLQYFKAVSLVEINNFEEADSLLSKISEGASVYAPKARWMLALSLLKQKRYEEVKKVISTISDSDTEYQKAQELLADL